MKPANGRTAMLAKLSLAVGLLSATALGVASAAPLGPQASLETDASLVAQVKHKHHHHRWPGVGGVIVFGPGYCAVQAATCEERYGEGTYRYWRCMRRAGCEW